jgi:hypothetical protein
MAKQDKPEKGDKGEKKGNPLVVAARAQYQKTLSDQGVPHDEIKQKVKAHIKEVVKPVFSAAKKSAAEKNLKGPAKKKFIEEEVRTKLGLQAAS